MSVTVTVAVRCLTVHEYDADTQQWRTRILEKGPRGEGGSFRVSGGTTISGFDTEVILDSQARV
jgi:hypothetical protein